MEKPLPNISHMGTYLSQYQGIMLPNLNTLLHKVNFMINELYALSEKEYPDSVYEALCLYPALLQSNSSCLEEILTVEEIQKFANDTPAITNVFLKTAKRFYPEDLTNEKISTNIKLINELHDTEKHSKQCLDQYANEIILLNCVYDLFHPEPKPPLALINKTIGRMVILRSLKENYPEEYEYAKKQAFKLVIENVALLENEIGPAANKKNLFTLLLASSVSKNKRFCTSDLEKLMKIDLNCPSDFICPVLDNQMSRRMHFLFNASVTAGKPIPAKDLSVVLGALIELSSDEETKKSTRTGAVPNVLHRLVIHVLQEKRDDLGAALPIIFEHTPPIKWMENTHQGFLKYLAARVKHGEGLQQERQCLAHQDKPGIKVECSQQQRG